MAGAIRLFMLTIDRDTGRRRPGLLLSGLQVPGLRVWAGRRLYRLGAAGKNQGLA